MRYSTSIFTRIPPFEIKEDTIPQQSRARLAPGHMLGNAKSPYDFSNKNLCRLLEKRKVRCLRSAIKKLIESMRLECGFFSSERPGHIAISQFDYRSSSDQAPQNTLLATSTPSPTQIKRKMKSHLAFLATSRASTLGHLPILIRAPWDRVFLFVSFRRHVNVPYEQ